MGARVRRKIAAGKDAKEIKKLHLMINRLAAYLQEHETNTVVMFQVVIEAMKCDEKVKELLHERAEKAKAQQASSVPQPAEVKEEEK